MKKNKINLLLNRTNYQTVELFFYRLRFVVLILAVVFIGILTHFILSFAKQNKAKQLLIEEKKIILQSLKERGEDQAKLIHLEKKYRILTEFLKEDAHPLPYYNLLNLALSSSTHSAQLKSFQINKNREVEFTVNFSNFSELMEFFKFIESEKFLKNFETLVLKSFSVSGNDINLNEDRYELAFTGRFFSINENKN